MTDKNRFLVEELEKRLLWYREEATDEEFDAEEVDAICTMLRKHSPEEPHKSKEEAYEDIMQKLRLEEASGGEGNSENAKESGVGGNCGKSDRGGIGELPESEVARERSGRNNGGKSDRERRRFRFRKNGLRAAIITIAVVGALFSLDRVTYAREDKSLFTMILERVGWLEIEKEPGVEGLVVDAGEKSGNFYDSWGDLSYEIKRKINVPEYIPENYSLYGIRCWEYGNREVLQSNYYDQGNGHLLIEITVWKDGADYYRENASDEDMYVLLPEYSDEETLYYSYEDEYICQAFMENSFYRISGNITVEELIKIREGLGDNRGKQS